jgi:hypothetical protein
MRSLLIKASLLFLSATLVVGLTEVALRLAHYSEGSRIQVQKIMEYDPLLGWRHKRNVSCELTSDDYDIIVLYNSQGLRGLDRPYRKPQNVTRIVVLGASFVDGFYVPVKDRMTEVLEASLGAGFEVINLGVTAYGTDQNLLLLETEGWKYQPDLVVLTFTYREVWQNGRGRIYAGAQKPVFTLDEGGHLTLTNVPVPHPAPPLQDRFKVYRLIRTAAERNRFLRSLVIKAGAVSDLPLAPAGAGGSPEEFAAYRRVESPELRKDWSITQALLRRVKQEADARGVRLVVFYVPTRLELSAEEWSNARLPPDYDPGEVARRLAGICQAEGIPYVEPSERFREAAKQGPLYFPHDPHWSPAGHHLAGRILAEYVENSWRREE